MSNPITLNESSERCQISQEYSQTSARSQQDTNVMRNHDGTVMLDHNGHIVHRDKFLSTKPLRKEIKERPGYGGKKFYYLNGECVIRTMNTVFGHTGWSTDVTMERLVQCEKDDMGRWNVGYLARVKISLLNGVSHEDCGSGEGINESKIKSHEKALKTAITDAMKRAARHLGQRLGNAIYSKGFVPKIAPLDNKSAIDELERMEAATFFGDQKKLRITFSKNESGDTLENVKEAASNLLPNDKKGSDKATDSSLKERLECNDVVKRPSPQNPYHRTIPQCDPKVSHYTQYKEIENETRLGLPLNSAKKTEINEPQTKIHVNANQFTLDEQNIKHDANQGLGNSSTSNLHCFSNPVLRCKTSSTDHTNPYQKKSISIASVTPNFASNSNSYSKTTGTYNYNQAMNERKRNIDQYSPSFMNVHAGHDMGFNNVQARDLNSVRSSLCDKYYENSEVQSSTSTLKRHLPTSHLSNPISQHNHIAKKTITNPYLR